MKKIVCTIVYLFCIQLAIGASIPYMKNTHGGYANSIQFQTNGDLKEFYASLDKEILSSNDSLKIEEYLKGRNRELLQILISKAPRTYEDASPDDQLLIFAGIVHMLAEDKLSGRESGSLISEETISILNGLQLKQAIRAEGFLDCVGAVVLGFFDVASLVEDYIALVQSGGSWSTVRGLIWRTAKRYAGWWAAAALVIEIGRECF